MKIVCSQCNATYKIADSKVPEKRTFAKCKKCGGRIAIEPGIGQSKPPASIIHSDSPGVDPGVGTAAANGNGHPAALLEDYPDLREYPPAVYAFGEILSRNKKGGYKSRRNAYILKILKSVRAPLSRLLRDGERVERIAFGTAYYPLEIFLGNGWLTMLYNRYALVATNQRLIMINTNHRMTKPAHYLFQMRYDEIKKVRRGLFRTNIILDRKKGKRRIFTGMKSYLSAELQQFFEGRIQPNEPLGSDAPLREHICPACFEPLPAKLETCSKCAAAFKTPKKAMLRSLVLPGWGDIYLGHRVLGFLELMGALMVWTIVLALFAEGAVGTGIFFLVLCNGIDALLTLHMARKGYILEKHQERMPMQAAQSPA